MAQWGRAQQRLINTTQQVSDSERSKASVESLVYVY